jgi:hypothetical protein
MQVVESDSTEFVVHVLWQRISQEDASLVVIGQGRRAIMLGK